MAEHRFRPASEHGIVMLNGGEEDWLYVRSFPPGLPDEINAKHLFTFLHHRFGPDSVMGMTDESEPHVVTEAIILVAKTEDGEVAHWARQLLDVIDRDGILCDESYWEEVSPILQKLWDETPLHERAALCGQADLGPEHITAQTVPEKIETILHDQVSRFQVSG